MTHPQTVKNFSFFFVFFFVVVEITGREILSTVKSLVLF
jgi:hypothetical protein